MSYHLEPVNDIGVLKAQWGQIMEYCPYVFPCAFERGQWWCVFGADERMPEPSYCPPLANRGFPVTDEEARIIAHLLRNWLEVQLSLPDEHLWPANYMNIPDYMRKWPRKYALAEAVVRDLREFVGWAERSGGFCAW